MSKTARQLGAEAYKEGKTRIAPLFWKGPKNKRFDADKSREWYKGWDEANLDEPITEWTDEENQALRDARKGGEA